MSVQLARPQVVRPGQYFYVCFPCLSTFSALQSHPYTAAWTAVDAHGKATSVSLLVKPQGGASQRLLRHHGEGLLTFLDGPYGTFEMQQYDSVILFCNNIGIAAMTLLLKDLLVQGRNDAKSPQVSLVWQLEQEG